MSFCRAAQWIVITRKWVTTADSELEVRGVVGRESGCLRHLNCISRAKRGQECPRYVHRLRVEALFRPATLESLTTGEAGVGPITPTGPFGRFNERSLPAPGGCIGTSAGDELLYTEDVRLTVTTGKKNDALVAPKGKRDYRIGG